LPDDFDEPLEDFKEYMEWANMWLVEMSPLMPIPFNDSGHKRWHVYPKPLPIYPHSMPSSP
jgi:hypothetical protein